MLPANIEKVFIRAKVKDKWGSYSLAQLYEMGQIDQIKRWFTEIILTRLIGVSEWDNPKALTRENVATMVEALRDWGVMITEIK